MFSKDAVISCICFVLLDCACSSTDYKTAQVGETVVFQCTLTENRPPGDISWLIEWDSEETFKAKAEKPGELYGEKFTDRGNYRTYYKSSGVRITHLCKLEITDVTIADSGTFSCVHNGWAIDHGSFYTSSLSVSEPQGGSPKCSFLPISTASSELTTGSVVQLECVIEEGETDTLTWYRKVVSDHVKISSDTGSKYTLNYILQDIDNGAELICKTSETGSNQRECSVHPFEQLPNATITQVTQQLSVGTNVSFLCCGEGIPRISQCQWFLNGHEVTSGHPRVTVIEANNCSELYISDISQEYNNSQLLCDVSIPNGLTASTVATIPVLAHQEDFTTTDSIPTLKTSDVANKTALQTQVSSTKQGIIRGNETTTIIQQVAPSKPSQNSYLIVPISVSLSLIFVVIAVAILVCVVYRRYNHGHHRGELASSKDQVPSEQQQTDNVAFTIPELIYEDNNISMLRQEGSSKPANKYDQQKNVEGLMYASLDLNDCTDGDEILHPAADEAVMYADVKRS